MNEFGLLDGSSIERLVREVAEELPATEPQRVLVIVGGSLLAWHGLRQSTEDVDSVRRLDDALRAAVRAVASRHGLSPEWLNDRATAFAPVTLDLADCDVLLEHPSLRVLGMPLRELFLMKVRRSDPADLNDIRTLWPHIEQDFASATEVVAAFHRAFPDEPTDEFLGVFIVDELAKGGFALPLT